MSKHTLSGIDFTNGARVNQSFDLSDNPIYGSAFKKDSNKEKSKTEKVDTFVEQVEAQSPFQKVSEAFGGIEKLPENLKPIKGVDQGFDLIGEPIKRVIPNYKIKGLKENEEVRILPYSNPKDPKYFIVDKKAPGISSLGSVLGGTIDFLTGQRTDLDRLGKDFGAKPKLIDLKDPSIYNLSKIETDLVNQELVNRGIDTVEDDATKGVDAATDKSIEQQRKQSTFDRRERLKDTLQTQATNFATIPFYTRLLEDAAKRRLELDKAMLGAREMMPSNIQNIMLSKQSQKSLASSAFAEEAKALAAQQEAATGFGGLGMQRSFGQPNVGNFKLG